MSDTNEGFGEKVEKIEMAETAAQNLEELVSSAEPLDDAQREFAQAMARKAKEIAARTEVELDQALDAEADKGDKTI